LHLLVIAEASELPLVVRELHASGKIELIHTKTAREACNPAYLSKVDAVLLCDLFDNRIVNLESSEIQLLADALVSNRLCGIVLSADASEVISYDNDAFVIVSKDISSDELWGRIAMIRRYRPFLLRIEEQVSTMQRFGKKLNKQFVEVDQELRLACRLQRDFLPKSFPEIGQIRFAALFRPATWVSGDVYDVRRLDETHIAVYLADAVGHGVAAGLLTMFIKQAIVGKRIQNEEYAIVDPSEVLASLNAELTLQELPNCQFATACYAIINTETNELTFARAGHPHPIYVSSNAECSELRTVGGLLGVFDNETYHSKKFVLQPGEKFIIYSDGLEHLIISKRMRENGDVQFTPEFSELVNQPAESLIQTLSAHLDQSEGSLQPDDDMTVLVIERLP